MRFGANDFAHRHDPPRGHGLHDNLVRRDYKISVFKKRIGMTPRRGAHVAYEPTCDIVGLGNPIERCLATTGRSNRRWDGGKLAMTQDARDDQLLGNGGTNAERAASA